MSDHKITIDFDGYSPTFRMVCSAPDDGLCHSVFDCDCEEYFSFKVVDGKPTHEVTYGGDPFRHEGVFDPTYCNLTEWLDNLDGEIVQGKITVPVRPEWDGDGYIFHIESDDKKGV